MTDHSTDDDSDEPRRSILPGELVADAFAELGGPDADSDDTIVTSLPSVADALRAASAEADRDSMLNIARSVASSDDDTSEAPARPRLPSSPQLRNPSNVRSPKAALPAAPPPPPSMRVSSVPAPDASTTRSSTPAPSRASLPPPSRVSLPAPSRVSLPPPSRVSLPPPIACELVCAIASQLAARLFTVHLRPNSARSVRTIDGRGIATCLRFRTVVRGRECRPDLRGPTNSG